MSQIDLINLAVRYGWLSSESDLSQLLNANPQKGDDHGNRAA